MNTHSPNTPNYHKWHALLKGIGNIILRIVCAGIAVTVGLWLVMASNMGPAYLPHIMDGALDFWIRITLLVAGLAIWIVTAVWLIWLILRYLYSQFKTKEKRL